MRLIKVRHATIPDDARALCERYGVPVIVGILTAGFAPTQEELRPIYYLPEVRHHAAEWLTEQHQRLERRDDWMLVMEVAITLFVLVEVILSVVSLVRGH